MALKNNTWKLNQWYDQDVAGNVSYSGSGELWVWGAAAAGRLGLNESPSANKSSPVQLPGTTWRSVSQNSRQDSFGATKTDGTLWSWGYNHHGQLGDNSRVNKSSPIQIPGTWSDNFQIGTFFSYGIRADGTLWLWGFDNDGALGVNTKSVSHSSPVQVPGTTWKQASLNTYASAAIKTDGTLWTWGAAGHGQTGTNSRSYYSSPVQVPGTTWDKITGNAAQYLAIKTDGTLWAWGLGSKGGLGLNQGGTIRYSSPVQVGSDTTWSNVVYSGTAQAIATKTDGTLWSWGYNNHGQLAQNDRTTRSSPVQIPGTIWSNDITSGSYFMGARKTDGTLWSWGINGLGPLGQSNIISYSSPVQIPGTDWTKIGSNQYSQFGIKNV